MPSFAWPWVFLLLPLPWLFYRWLPPAIPQQSSLKAPFFNELEQLVCSNKPGLPYRGKALVMALVWLLLIGSAARPQTIHQELHFPDNSRALFLAIDISNSMLTADLQLDGEPASRMSLVKSLANTLLAQRPGDRIGLILFASQPYLQSPPTLDHTTLNYWLTHIQPGMAGENTSIGDAIGLAIKHLQNSSAEEAEKVILLITDGANNSGVMPPQTAAALAAEHGLTLHCLGVGTTTTANAHTGAGNALDESLLQNLSSMTGGQYFHLQHASQLDELANLFDLLEPGGQAVQRHHIHELYPWPLGLASLLVCLLALYRLLQQYWSRQEPGLPTHG